MKLGKLWYMGKQFREVIWNRSLLRWSAGDRTRARWVLMSFSAHYGASASRKMIWAAKLLNTSTPRMRRIRFTITPHTPQRRRSRRHRLKVRLMEERAMSISRQYATLTFSMFINLLIILSLTILFYFIISFWSTKLTFYLKTLTSTVTRFKDAKGVLKIINIPFDPAVAIRDIQKQMKKFT